MIRRDYGIRRTPELTQIGWRGLDVPDCGARAVAGDILDRFEDVYDACAVVGACEFAGGSIDRRAKLPSEVHWLLDFQGTLMKWVNNFICGLEAASIAEGLKLMDAGGLNRSEAMAILTRGAPGSGIEKGVAERVAANEYTPNFMLRWMAKDLSYALKRSIRKEHLARNRGCGFFSFSAPLLKAMEKKASPPSPRCHSTSCAGIPRGQEMRTETVEHYFRSTYFACFDCRSNRKCDL